jgi:Spy/CpxP family protein refolding chaperone
MKKIVIVMGLTFSTIVFSASTVKNEADLFQEMYGKNKKEVLAQHMKLSASQVDKFWEVYESYEAERKQLGQIKLELINEYAKNFTTLTNENADKIAIQTLQNNMDYEKLYSKYYKKAKSALGAKEAAKFIQLEVYFQTVLRTEVQNSIPIIGEIEKSTQTDW